MRSFRAGHRRCCRHRRWWHVDHNDLIQPREGHGCLRGQYKKRGVGGSSGCDEGGKGGRDSGVKLGGSKTGGRAVMRCVGVCVDASVDVGGRESIDGGGNSHVGDN